MNRSIVKDCPKHGEYFADATDSPCPSCEDQGEQRTMNTKYHVERYEQENGKTVWFVATINGDMATGEQYPTKLDAECELIQLQQAERDIEYIEKKNKRGSIKKITGCTCPEPIGRAYGNKVFCQRCNLDLPADYFKQYSNAPRNQRGSIIPELCWLVATLLLAMLFIVPTVRHYDAQIETRLNQLISLRK